MQREIYYAGSRLLLSTYKFSALYERVKTDETFRRSEMNKKLYGRFTFSPILVTAISIKVVPRAKRKSRIQARKAAGNR
jgi:hypothetical protein